MQTALIFYDTSVAFMVSKYVLYLLWGPLMIKKKGNSCLNGYHDVREFSRLNVTGDFLNWGLQYTVNENFTAKL